METVLRAQELSKVYGKFAALDHLDLELTKGEVLGYLGPNGAGKTTTIRLLLGLIQPSGGTATIFGKNVTREAAELHRYVAYVPGETSFWPSLTGAETLRFLANLRGGTDETYQKELMRKFEFDPNKKVRTYSKGNRQKIALIAALASRARLLVFDEPTSGLDPVMAKAFRDEVRIAKENEQTVFLSSHMLEEVEELCDRVAILNTGRLVEQGTLEQLQHLSAMTVEASFHGDPPSVKHIAGVEHVEVHGHFLRCQVNGSIDELLATVAKAKPITFLSRKPSLEELFLALYEPKSKAKVAHHAHL